MMYPNYSPPASLQVRAIVVLPSQELAQQVYRVFEQVAHGLEVKVAFLSTEIEQLVLMNKTVYPRCSGVDVVVSTPGRLVEHLRAGTFATLRSVPGFVYQAYLPLSRQVLEVPCY